MNTVTSKDGTTIAYEKYGTTGPAVILVCGGSVDSSSNTDLAKLLSGRFTVYNYERRGRGASGDTPPYTVEREVEDIAAVAREAGGTAYIYGASSGAALAMEAARMLPGVITKLAMWEPPYIPEGFPRPPADTARTFSDLVAQGRRGDAAEFFMAKVVGLPPEFVAQARGAPWWPHQEALAHTLAYDATIMGDYRLPTDRAAEVKVPALVLDGGASFPFMHPTAVALAQTFPHGEQRTLEGQRHDASAEVLAAAVGDFFAA